MENKPLHRYLFEKIEADDEIDQEASNQWLHSGMSSQVEGYINAMQEQEIATNATKKRRSKDQTMNSKCRLCELNARRNSTTCPWSMPKPLHQPVHIS